MKVQPVIILGLDGRTAIQPIQAADLEALASETTLAAVLAALQAQGGDTKGTETTVGLVAAVADAPVDLGTLTTVQRLKVLALSGAAATLKIGAATEVPLTLAEGDEWEGLDATALLLNSPGGAGGTITLQLWGR